ncbi:Neuropeptide F [Blattella germanica]|nr:Neuropeptide F [Blattella germanica]
MQSSLCWLLVVGCTVVLIPYLAPGVWGKSADPDQLAAMADTLRYLQELDRYYSQVARPRSVPS